MSRPGTLFGDIQGFGCVYDCGDCGNIHVSIGPMSVMLAPDAFMQLVALIHTSAANFEAYLQHQSQCGNEYQEGIHAERDSDADPA